MEQALRILIPKITDVEFEVYPYQCKQDLLSKLPDRLRGYAHWLPPDWRIVVIVDRDDDDCAQLKQRMDAAAASLRTRNRGSSGNYQVVSRMAIEELEAWFFGDWEAVRSAYPKVSPNIPSKQGYRDSDAIAGGTWEALERHLKRAGYFRTGLRKVEAARTIAQHMNPDRNRSASFRALLHVLREDVGYSGSP